MQFDYVVIGIGSTGCAGLARLSDSLAVTDAVGGADDNQARVAA